MRSTQHIKSFLLYLCIVLSPNLWANLQFKNYSISDGLAQSQVFSIVQDHNGYLWFGTNGGGVSRFDGTEFTNFTNDDGLSNNVVNAMMEDSKNTIWIGTEVGITLYKDHLFSTIERIDGLPNDNINAFYEDKEGRMWIGTTEGFCYMKDGKITLLEMPKVDGFRPTVYSIAEDKYGTLWIGTTVGLYSMIDGKFKRYTVEDGLIDNQITELKLLNNGDFYVATILGINKMDNGKLTKNPVKVPHLTNLRVNEIFQDSKDNLWIGTDQGVVLYEPNKNYKIYNREQGLSYERVMHVLEDRDGKFWFGTDGAGVDFFRGNLFSGFSEENGLYNNTVWSILQFNDQMWFGHDEGLSVYDGEKITNYVNGVDDPNFNPAFFSKNELSKKMFLGRTVYVLFKDRSGNVWIGTESGISIFDGNSYRYITLKDGLPSDQIFSIIQAKDGKIWVGTRDGLALLENEKVIKVFRKQQGLPINRINVMVEDRLGKIWIGTSLGLTVYDGKKFKTYGKDDGLNNNFIFGLIIDKNENIWIGTYGGGVTLFKNAIKDGVSAKNSIVFTNKDGMTDNEILLLIESNRGDIFAGSNKGLNKIVAKEYFKTGKKVVKTFSKKEGFEGQECDMAATFKSADGVLWFGTIGGVIAYHQEFDVPNSVETKTNITRIRLDFKDTLLAQNSILDYKHNKISFSFIGISTSNPEKVLYQFMLEGYDEKWSPITTDLFAAYANLPQGDYIFKVKSCNEDGLWNKETTRFAFSVTPPFWKTYWFYGLCILAIISIIYTYVHWHEKALQATNQILEQKINERTSELNQKNKELEKLSIVARETHNSVLICDSKGEMEWVNTGFTKLFGFTLDEYIELKGSSIIKASFNVNIAQIIQESITNKKHVVYETKKTTKSGEELHIQSTLTPILNAQNEVDKLVIIDADITELKSTKVEIEEKNKDIMDSIHYAYRIQQAMLPPIEEIRNCQDDFFILFKPKDIVSGDFYWYHRINPDNPNDTSYLIAAVDCTGHGVPGAFMSMIGNNILNQIITENQLATPEVVLSKLNLELTNALHQEEIIDGAVRDGMDIALCLVKPEENLLYYAGANRPLLRSRKYEGEDYCQGTDKCVIGNGYLLDEFGADRKAIGGFTEREYQFSLQIIPIQEGDSFYIYSDGYVDQFGEVTGKKLMSKRFKNRLIELQNENMEVQGKELDGFVTEWQGNLSQLDDILVIGLKF